MAVMFTDEQGLELLATQPDVVKSLSKVAEYKEFFARLSNIEGSKNVHILETDGLFTLPFLGAVTFETLSFVAMSKMSLQSNGVYNNEAVYPEFAEIQNAAQAILKSIEVASDGQYEFFNKTATNDKGESSPREPLRAIVAARLR
jgi:hypothetical protein